MPIFYIIIDFVLALAEFSITNSIYCSDHFPFKFINQCILVVVVVVIGDYGD